MPPEHVEELSADRNAVGVSFGVIWSRPCFPNMTGPVADGSRKLAFGAIHGSQVLTRNGSQVVAGVRRVSGAPPDCTIKHDSIPKGSHTNLQPHSRSRTLSQSAPVVICAQPPATLLDPFGIAEPLSQRL